MRRNEETRAMGPHILILDDDPVIVCVATLIAQSVGCSASSVASVAKCLDRLDAGQDLPAAIVADIFMPEGDAFDLLRGLAAREFRIPLIVITGIERWYLDVIREFAQVWDVEILDTLTKPLNHEQLANSLRKLL
jgi:CheY-like chemotaxis protein